MKNDSGWWDEFFPDFRMLFDILSKKDTNAVVRYVIRKLDLKRGRTFLDCPCGIGRISLPLAQKGVRVTGIDITPSYLEELARKAERKGLKIRLEHCDMRRIRFDRQFDAAANLWTSFGYFDKEADNLLTLKRMYRALKPGGRFMLQVINRDWVLVNFAARNWSWAGKIRIIEEHRFDYATSIMHGTFCHFRDGHEVMHLSKIRMYSYHELVSMLRGVGFVDIEGYGSLQDDPISRDTRMMHIIATRPR